MVLNWIWISFFLIAFLMAAGRSLSEETSGVERHHERILRPGGIRIRDFARTHRCAHLVAGNNENRRKKLESLNFSDDSSAPSSHGCFPGIPKGHPAMGAIFMNISANMLGLDNAATPMGLKAMQEMQSLNPKKDTATDAMIMFLVLNSSGLCLIPISIMMYRAQGGAANPTDVFIPILIATAIATT